MLQAAGVPEPSAKVVATSLALADARGLHSHGIDRLGVYIDRIQHGSIDPVAVPTVVVDKGPTLLLDAHNGLGIVAGYHATLQAIERARQYGVAFCGVRRSSHFGMAAYFALLAAEAGMICLAMSGADAYVAPWGAAERYIGTNPLAIGIPGEEEPPFLADMATSVAAAGKIALAKGEGVEIPEGWALDKEGRPTTDPSAALDGALLPFGGPKGSAIGLMIDLFCGALIGAAPSRQITPLYYDLDKPQSLGHCFIVIDPGALGEASAFARRIDAQLRELRGLRPASGFSQVLAPGDVEHRKYMASMEKGVELPGRIFESFAALAKRFGIDIG